MIAKEFFELLSQQTIFAWRLDNGAVRCNMGMEKVLTTSKFDEGKAECRLVTRSFQPLEAMSLYFGKPIPWKRGVWLNDYNNWGRSLELPEPEYNRIFIVSQGRHHEQYRSALLRACKLRE